MLTKCDGCGAVYDDECRTTICPHGTLGASGSKYAYCRKHDLFDCPLHDDSPTKTDLYGVVRREGK